MSTGGGVQPVWAPDGTALYYRAGRSTMAVAVDAGEPAAWGRPARLFEYRVLMGMPAGPRHFDIAPDGRRYLVPAVVELMGGSREIVVVQSWFDELTRLVNGSPARGPSGS